MTTGIVLPGKLSLGARANPEHRGVLERRTAEPLATSFGGVARCGMTAVADGPDSSPPVVLSRLPTLRMVLAPGDWSVSWFASDWGDEYSPRTQPLTGPLELAVTTGRSSKGTHPWVCLERSGDAVVLAPAWSGNWSVEMVPAADGSVRVEAGISAWKFTRRLDARSPFVAPHVYLAWAPDRASAAAALADAVGRSVVPSNGWTQEVPLEWNHWWPYEDAEIDADTFLANARVAASLGLAVSTLDAGWFGAPDATTFWERQRGDWDSENTQRFPSGLMELARQVREAGQEFGVWIEAEAVGLDAVLNSAAPQILARRDDDPSDPPPDPGDPGWLGYVCLGAPAGREHLRGVLERLVARTGCRWVKLDFNVDPGAGCSRTDHGHDAGDGLYEHYRGLYAALDEVRTAHPEILLESCSSGGLRIDLGLLSHVHCAFLSDPDWTEFHLQLLWGAAQMLPAAAILHFTQSQWRTFHPRQGFDPEDVDLPTFDTMVRAVMLHRFGLSYRLSEFPQALLDRLREHIAVFRAHVAPLVRDHGLIRPLTAQPLRDGAGDRFPAFQLQAGERSVLGVYRLEGAIGATTARLAAIDPEHSYRLRLLGPDGDPDDVPLLDGGTTAVVPGRVLQRGLQVRSASSATSWLVAVDPIGAAEVP